MPPSLPDVVDVPKSPASSTAPRMAEAELDYRLNGSRFILIHTEVPDALSGHGLGGRLVRAALDRAVREGLTVVPWCPFARHWLQEHPDEAARVTLDWEATPDPVKRAAEELRPGVAATSAGWVMIPMCPDPATSAY